jgi:hypothetical protein
MPLSMKQKLQLMSFVSELSEPTATQELINKAVKRLGVSVNTADLKEACRNAEVKWSAVCGQSGSPVSVLHNRVSNLLEQIQQITESQRTMLDRIEVLERKLKGLE